MTSNVIQFRERAARQTPIAHLEARVFLQGFRYRVTFDGAAQYDTHSLEDARDFASYFAKETVEVGPVEALG